MTDRERMQELARAVGGSVVRADDPRDGCFVIVNENCDDLMHNLLNNHPTIADQGWVIEPAEGGGSLIY